MPKRENRITVYNTTDVAKKLGITTTEVRELCHQKKLNGVYNPTLDDYIIPKFELDIYRQKNPGYTIISGGNNILNAANTSPQVQPVKRGRGRPRKLTPEEQNRMNFYQTGYNNPEPVPSTNNYPTATDVVPMSVHDVTVEDNAENLLVPDQNVFLQQIIAKAKSVEVTVYKFTM